MSTRVVWTCIDFPSRVVHLKTHLHPNMDKDKAASENKAANENKAVNKSRAASENKAANQSRAANENKSNTHNHQLSITTSSHTYKHHTCIAYRVYHLVARAPYTAAFPFCTMTGTSSTAFWAYLQATMNSINYSD